MSINFFSSKDFDETRCMLTKSDNTENMMGSGTDDVIEELCESFYKDIKKDQKNQ